jgi:prepilin-type N-terminal cleavage/methylation domain-containing protein
MREAERGFTLVEMLVSVAIMLVVSMAALILMKSASRTLEARVGEQSAGIALAEQVNRMQSDASTADAVWAPNLNEVDFYSITSATDAKVWNDPNGPRAGLYWKYVYDSSTHTVARFDYTPISVVGVVRKNVAGTTGYAPILGVSAFSARMVSADKVLAGVAAHAYPVNVGGNGVIGGNGIVVVTITTPAGTRVVHLTAGNMPSGFTVVNAVSYKGIVYRLNLTHRLLGGLASKTHVLMKGEVFVSYDGWKTKAPWCDYQIYRDKNEMFNANDPREKPDHMRAICAEVFKAPLPTPKSDGSLPNGVRPFEAPDTWYDGGVGNQHNSWWGRCAPAVLLGGPVGAAVC